MYIIDSNNKFLWSVVLTVSPVKLYPEDESKIRQKALRSHGNTLFLTRVTVNWINQVRKTHFCVFFIYFYEQK